LRRRQSPPLFFGRRRMKRISKEELIRNLKFELHATLERISLLIEMGNSYDEELEERAARLRDEILAFRVLPSFVEIFEWENEDSRRNYNLRFQSFAADFSTPLLEVYRIAALLEILTSCGIKWRYISKMQDEKFYIEISTTAMRILLKLPESYEPKRKRIWASVDKEGKLIWALLDKDSKLEDNLTFPPAGYFEEKLS
jgi:hypothetical protein